jgi:hypothetical protein
MNTPFSKSISGPSTIIVATPALGIITQDPNKLPYTTFYDASWTLSNNQFKSSRAVATVLPSVLASMNPPLVQPGITPQLAGTHHHRVSDRSLTSEYSQYSTLPLAPKDHYRGQPLSYRPMQTLVSDMEVQTMKDGSAGEGSEGDRGAVVVDLAPCTTSDHTRHYTIESSGTQSSSKYSQYSTH